jgi:AcrR family transcriptional regulator
VPFKILPEMISQQDEARTMIIDIARNIFSHFGFKKTTMEEIAQASRKGKSSIYYYFSSKEDIFKAVVEKEADELLQEITAGLEKIEDPVEKLKFYISTRMKRIKQLKNFYTALKSDYFNKLEFIEEIRKKYDYNEVKIITSILQKGIDDGKFSIENPHQSAVAIVTAMKGLEIPLFISKGNSNFEDRMNNLVNYLFYGIVKR